MIAPYWSDIDTRCGGDIFYRQVKLEPNDKLYGRIRDDVGRTGLASNFEPTSTIIVTWESVTPQNRIPCQDQKVCDSESHCYCHSYVTTMLGCGSDLWEKLSTVLTCS